MATSFRHTGRHEDVTSASGTIASGAIVWQENIFGIAIKGATIGQSLVVDTHGVHNLPVPASTVKGERIYATLVYATDQVVVALKRTSGAGDTLVGIARSDRDALGNALVKLADQPFNVAV